MRLIAYMIVTMSALSFVILFRSKPLPEKFMNKIADPVQFQLIMDHVFEYIPVWAASPEEVLAEKERDSVHAVSGDAMSQIIETIKWGPEKRAISVKAFEPSILRIKTFYFPGWEAKIDGKKTEIYIEEPSGAMLINIPQGSHVLELRFVDTPLRIYSKIITGFSVGMVIFLWCYREKIFYKDLKVSRQ